MSSRNPALARDAGLPASHKLLMPPQYASALQLARLQDWTKAREAFEECCAASPDFVKAWVSWAQLEKRVSLASADTQDRFKRCREVLQRGLQMNPQSAALCQAWGLMELQKGNWLAAILLLERCVAHDPRCSPVLRWKQVQAAKQLASVRRKHRPAARQHTSSRSA
jgi:lipopolysaccharide biosynthesis regulator YciM